MFLKLLVIAIFAILLFGAKRLPELGRSLGETIKGFRNSVSGKDEEKQD